MVHKLVEGAYISKEGGGQEICIFIPRKSTKIANLLKYGNKKFSTLDSEK